MGKLYHINGDSISPCKAVKGNCPYGQGAEENHFSDVNEAMKVLEERFEQEYGNTESFSKKETTAKDLVKQGVTGKELRDALRKENPTWSDKQVHTVAGIMTKNNSDSNNTNTVGKKQEAVKQELQSELKDTISKKGEIREKLIDINKHMIEYDLKHGLEEGRAYYYDYRNGRGKVYGENPNGKTYYDVNPKYTRTIKQLQKELQQLEEKRQKVKTDIEEAGLGHTLSDRGNVLRVRTQAQKWLLENELKGQISDGKWENTSPKEHWKEWSNAEVVVDPDNAGRNFAVRKDNYQLNASDLLSDVGKRMIDNVKENTGKDYSYKEMMTDLKDLRNIFKTSRPRIDDKGSIDFT